MLQIYTTMRVTISGRHFNNEQLLAYADDARKGGQLQVDSFEAENNCLGPVMPELPFVVLTRLNKCYLDMNHLEEFPIYLLQCVNLEFLSLAHNSITELPSNFHFKRLRGLDLRLNRLKKVDTLRAEHLPAIEEIFLQGNADLPPKLAIDSTMGHGLSFVKNVQKWYDTAERNCNRAIWAFLIVYKRPGFARMFLGKDVIRKISKIIWETRHDSVWFWEERQTQYASFELMNKSSW